MIPHWKVVIRERLTGRCVQIHECVALTKDEAIQSAKDCYSKHKDDIFKAKETGK